MCGRSIIGEGAVSTQILTLSRHAQKHHSKAKGGRHNRYRNNFRGIQKEEKHLTQHAFILRQNAQSVFLIARLILSTTGLYVIQEMYGLSIFMGTLSSCTSFLPGQLQDSLQVTMGHYGPFLKTPNFTCVSKTQP